MTTLLDQLNDKEFPITCGLCQGEFSVRFRELKNKTELTCPKCRKAFRIDTTPMMKDIEQMNAKLIEMGKNRTNL